MPSGNGDERNRSRIISNLLDEARNFLLNFLKPGQKICMKTNFKCMYSYTKTTSISWPFYVIIYLRRKMVIMNNHHYFLNNLKEIKCNIKEKISWFTPLHNHGCARSGSGLGEVPKDPDSDLVWGRGQRTWIRICFISYADPKH